MSDQKILEIYGWEMECESPLEICYTETGDRATGVAARLVIESLRADRAEYEEQERKLDAFGRL